ncbi:MAG: hypothetical protein JOY71_31875 [Acetobacteraceae bacterium]|nr:hypothetical protein [Acetobacteraceae bacterium]
MRPWRSLRRCVVPGATVGDRTLRLHDNMIWYLRDRIGPDGCLAAHAAMVRFMSRSCGERCEQLPKESRYGWKFPIRHLRAAGQDQAADRLLADYAWIKAKLQATDARALFESYLPESKDEGARLVGGPSRSQFLPSRTTPTSLRQIFGRLGSIDDGGITNLIAAAKNDRDFRPSPRWRGLISLPQAGTAALPRSRDQGEHCGVLA